MVIPVSNAGIGEIDTKPVSLLQPVELADKSFTGLPASVAIQAANLGDPDLVGLWHMDGDWLDSSGNGNHLTPVNGAYLNNDKIIGTQSGTFNGSSTYARSASSTGMPLGSTPRTLMAWVKPFSYPDSGYNGIISYGSLPSYHNNGCILSVNNSGRISCLLMY
jgi:hypothetical protein